MHIYRITNVFNGKVYIGKTHDTVASRWNQHCSLAKNGSKFYFHNAIRKYGAASFLVETLASASSKQELIELEKAFIISYESTNPSKGYNLTKGGEGGMSYPGARNPFFGKHHTETTKQILRACGLIHVGRKRSTQTRLKMSLSAQGKSKSLAHCTAISAAKKGKPGLVPSAAGIERIREAKRQWWAARRTT